MQTPIEILKKIYLPLIGIVACLVVFLLANSGRYFGAFINRFHPCVDAVGTSFPCYGVYDITIMIISVVVALVFAGIAAYAVFHN